MDDKGQTIADLVLRTAIIVLDAKLRSTRFALPYRQMLALAADPTTLQAVSMHSSLRSN